MYFRSSCKVSYFSQILIKDENYRTL